MVDHEIVDSGLHALCLVHVTIAHVVDGGELEAFQPEQSSRCRNRTIGDGAQNVDIDETNI